LIMPYCGRQSGETPEPGQETPGSGTGMYRAEGVGAESLSGVRASTVNPAAGNGWRSSDGATEGEDNRVGNTIWSIWVSQSGSSVEE
jgi:hypothetical protein